MNFDDWDKELKAEEKAHKDYRADAQKVVDRYEDEKDRNDTKFNILWSNTEVIHSAVYAKTPIPDIRRRFLDRDPDGKKAAEVAERAVSYCLDTYDFDGTLDVAVDDYLIAGLGQVRLSFKPYFEEKTNRTDLLERHNGYDPVTFDNTYGVYNGEEEVLEYMQDEQGYYSESTEEELVYEEVTSEPINWNRFRWQPAARWEDVDWACIDHYMTKEDIEEDENLKDHADEIPLGYSEAGEKDVEEDQKSRGLIHEIFDKKNRTYIYIAEGLNKILAEIDDPLGLEGFYPFPKPLVATLKNGKFLPIPDYLFYQDQAIELDTITNRINRLTEELKYRGVYDGSFTALQNISTVEDGKFIPIDDFMERFQGKGDLEKVIAAMPLEDLQRVISQLYIAREQIKQVIYEITGIADIMRGTTKASETLGAQQLKTQFGSMRLSKRQRRTAHFVRDIIRLKVEIMVENFQTKTLSMMTGQEITPEVEKILKDDMMRSYRIDIETDSTITEDAQTEKQGRIELITAITGFMEKGAPLIQTGIMPKNVFTELLGFVVRGFKIGRTLEDTIDEMGGDQNDPRMQQMEGQMKQQIEQMKQQVAEYVQNMQQDFQKKEQALEGKLFEAQKKLAINVESKQASIAEARIKGDIAVQTSQDKVEILAQLEAFKARLNAILRPEESEDKLNDMIEIMGQAFMHQQQENSEIFDSLTKRIEETDGNVTKMSDYMKKPAKVIRDKSGKVTGATRD